MSLQRVKAALSTAEYAPHTLTLGSEFDFEALSPGAASLFAAAFPEGVRLADLLSSEPWSPSARRRYNELAPEERIEVLAAAGFHNHELIHRIDFLTTPFGAGFHGRACLESIGLLLESAELVATLEWEEPHRPLRDIPALADAIVVSSGADTLNARIRWFDALRGAAPKHLEPGWMDAPAALDLAGQKLDLAMVHELVPTVMIPGTGGAYFRPMTILESRAVALTSLLLLNRLGGDRAAAADIALFLEAFYTPSESFPDYRFLLDLFLGLWGVGDFLSLVDEHGVAGLQALLKSIAVLGWYALHASPAADPEGMANSNPMLRLVAALQELQARVRDGEGELDAAEFLGSVDSGERARAFGFTGSRETLGYSLGYVHKVRRLNHDSNPHAGLQAHFEKVLSIQQRQLERRFDHGYDFPAGMPDSGSAISGLGSHPDATDLLFDDEHEPAPEVFDWFRLREMLLFRHARPPGFWSEVWSAIGTHPGLGATNPEDARELALSRARFVAGGSWPSGGGIVNGEDGSRLVYLPVRTSTLPETFRAAAAAEEVSVETAWQVLLTGGEPIVALRAAFPDAGEEARLLLTPSLHRPALEAILSSGRVALLGDRATHAFEGGENHPESIYIPVTAAPEILANALEREAPTAELRQTETGWMATYSRDGEQLPTVSIEAYEWPTSDAFEWAVAAIGPAGIEGVTVAFSGLPHPADGGLRVLGATGAGDSLERVRGTVIEPNGGTPHPLPREQAESLLFDFQRQVVEQALERGGLPYRRGELKPLPVDLNP